jgi:hypothetical protein
MFVQAALGDEGFAVAQALLECLQGGRGKAKVTFSCVPSDDEIAEAPARPYDIWIAMQRGRQAVHEMKIATCFHPAIILGYFLSIVDSDEDEVEVHLLHERRPPDVPRAKPRRRGGAASDGSA